MRPDFNHLEKFRIEKFPRTEAQKAGRYGGFNIPINNGLVSLLCIADDGSFGPLPNKAAVWEHVSISARPKGSRLLQTPHINEIQLVKTLFFLDNEAAALFFPPQGFCFGIHPYIVDLWRPVTDAACFPLPPLQKI